MKITHKWLKTSRAKAINFVIVEKQGSKTLSPVEKIISRFVRLSLTLSQLVFGHITLAIEH